MSDEYEVMREREREAVRQTKLELRVEELQRHMAEAEINQAKLMKQCEEFNQKLYRAEAWGRAVIWTTIALGGMATQAGTVMEWIRRV